MKELVEPSYEDMLQRGLDNWDRLESMIHRANLMKRTLKPDTEKTIELVKAAQGQRSMRKFSEDLGVNVSTISRILKGEVVEIRASVLALMAYNAEPDSDVTLDKLLDAQGFTIPEEREPVNKRKRKKSELVVSEELLIRGYSVKYQTIDADLLTNWHIMPSYIINTDAFSDEKGCWYFFDELSWLIKKVSFNMLESWITKAITMYYLGVKANRISVVVDSPDVYRALKLMFGNYNVRDEISIILVSFDRRKVVDEYILPLIDERVPEFSFEKEEQNEEDK